MPGVSGQIIKSQGDNSLLRVVPQIQSCALSSNLEKGKWRVHFQCTDKPLIFCGLVIKSIYCNVLGGVFILFSGKERVVSKQWPPQKKKSSVIFSTTERNGEYNPSEMRQIMRKDKHRVFMHNRRREQNSVCGGWGLTAMGRSDWRNKIILQFSFTSR